jgi:hypothetical protein
VRISQPATRPDGVQHVEIGANLNKSFVIRHLCVSPIFHSVEVGHEFRSRSVYVYSFVNVSHVEVLV